jgi:hypothetical protein
MNDKKPNINKEPRNKALCAPSLFIQPPPEECYNQEAQEENKKEIRTLTSVSEHWRYHLHCM